MKRIGFIVFSGALFSVSAFGNSQAATQIIPGSKCAKAGITKVVASKKFTCIKSGKKLVWDRGLAILVQPIFIATPAFNNYEWVIEVTNYQAINRSGLEFSYSFAVDGGIWNLYSKTNSPSEKIVVNQAFNLLELKVAVSDSSNQYVTSPQFQRQFRVRVIPPLTPTPSNSSSNSQNPLPVAISTLLGVQWRNEPGYYLGSTPAARVLFRWPKPLIENLRGYIINYENTKTFTPPCDLSKALCDAPKRVDSTNYKKVINDASVEFVVIDGLAVSSPYEFTFYAVSGGISDIEKISLPSTGFKIFILTAGEIVPEAPTDVKVG